MKKISFFRILVQFCWLALIILSFVSERVSYFRTFILLGTILLGPIYCGWFCVFGTFQEVISKLGNKILKRRYKLPKNIHNYLKSFRYILLVITFLAFLQAINNYDGRKTFFSILPKVQTSSTQNIKILEDKKTDSSNIQEVKKESSSESKANKSSQPNSAPQKSKSLIWGIVLFYGILSFFVDRPFCSYLCTEGARYGLLGKLRLFSIKRNESTCVNCKKCDKVCPMNIEVSKQNVVQDEQCISCFNCIESCPKKDTLKIGKVF